MDDYNRLLVVLVVQQLRNLGTPLAGTADEVEALLTVLRARYVAASTPYGDDEQGFQRWLLDHWLAPPMA